MSDLKTKLKGEEGFIAIVGLIILAIMSSYMITLGQTMVNTVGSVKRWNNFYAASYGLGVSVEEYLLYISKEYEAGFNTGEIVCNYGKFAEEGETEGGGYNNFCQVIDNMVSHPAYENKDIQIKLEIKGRADTDESFGGCTELGFSGDCYVVPFPGTGTAGEENRCRVYDPIFAAGSASTLIDHNGRQLEEGGIEGEDGISQIDYACNWNKLTFGSSITDRAAIPFYYQADDDTIISPFHEDPDERGGTTQAQNFIVRVRTPCLPCVYEDGDVDNGVNRLCSRGDDPTICKDYDQYPNERYELKVNGVEDDDVVVQWQLTGLCEEDGEDEECGLIQYVEYETGEEIEKIASYFSGISEGRINYNINLSHEGDDQNHKLLYGDLKGFDTTTYKIEFIKYFTSGKLPAIKQPFLTLFLSNKLISNADRNVPYLEYQVLTDQPIGNQSTELQVTVTVDGNGFKKTIYLDNSKPLIDFAVQN